jgi:FtsP/CotA-like multicopper oxidase with cupredoxin domain
MDKLFRFAILAQFAGLALIASSAQVGNCPSYPSLGDPVTNPLDLYSQGGALNLQLELDYGVDSSGYQHFCYNYFAAGIEAPTLRLNPSDTLTLTLTNGLNVPGAKPMRMKHQMNMPAKAKSPDTSCNGGTITLNSTNLHFHGLNIPPVCHQDDVINTLIQPTDPPFQYQIQIPGNEPPGLYWYHPHPHGFTTDQVNGGASGALIVSGIENVKPQVAGLAEQVLILRQQFLNPGSWLPGPYQLTLNFEPVGQDILLVKRGQSRLVSKSRPNTGAQVQPVRTVLPYIVADPEEQQFWRVLNSSTQAFLDLQVLSDDVPQNLELISIDAVPVTNDPYVTDILVPPAGRAEFVMTGPPEGASNLFVNLGYNTGPVGNTNFAQVLASILTSSDANTHKLRIPAKHHIPAAKVPPAKKQRFASLAQMKPTASRNLYFSEATMGTNGPTNYFLTVQGQTAHVFDPSLPPAIVTNSGAVEDWTIENHTLEEHAFHIHQIHFLVMAINGVALQTPVMQDTVNIPYWDGTMPYPSVTVRMDFSDPEIAGTFLYHCHILDHEDGGMMAEIQVNPASQ